MGKTKKRKLNRRRIRALSAILFSIPFVLYTALVPAIKAGAVTNPGAGVVQLDLDPLNITITNDANTQHTTQNYIYDYNTNTAKNADGTVYGEVINDIPLLFPGDTVTFVPVELNEDVHTGYVGCYLETDTATEIVTDVGPIKVLRSTSYGNDPSKTFVQKIQIVGSNPVRIACYGGGGYAKTTIDGKDYSLNYYHSTVTYNVLPASVNVDYVCTIDGVCQDISASPVVYNAETELPATFYAEDALLNFNQSGSYVVTLNRPYMEGFSLTRVTKAHEGYEKHTQSTVYDAKPNFTQSQKRNDATFTMTPWMDPGHQKGVMEKGANTEGVYVAFEFSKDITLTVDVNDGATAKKYYEIWPNVGNFDAAWVAEPSREGYTFLGWYPDGAEVTDANKITDVKTYIDNNFSNNAAEVSGRACKIHAEWEKDGEEQGGEGQGGEGQGGEEQGGEGQGGEGQGGEGQGGEGQGGEEQGGEGQG